ncbi:NHLP bacteriocin export ABC transporter permease/ATPase subunit [Oribacterium sp. P6A1]|uniref:NHLP bacteriocin export ABC transporter permease/ATPase subunit n=1 Tax=Oribacterium sp. P6A1 TaxID=1410612 RepID=UPI00056CEBC6|nr:NHLP bacteriocin export ABC transporter permease/ATPase subunit [Oribacterium sp. P6A1]
MGWFDNQIKLRKQNDEQALSNTFRKIAGAVTGETFLDSGMDAGEKAKNAIEEILRYYHVRKTDIPKKIVTIEEKLDYVLHPSGIMYRRVKLTPGFRNDAFGAMIGFRKPDGAPVALLPYGLTGYRFFDDISGKYTRVTGKNETDFTGEAFSFYRPFPVKKLGIADLFSYILHIIEPSDYVLITLATLVVILVSMLTPRINLFLFRDVIAEGEVSLLIVTAMFLLCTSWGALMLSAAKNLISQRIDTKMSISVEAATMMRIMSLPAGFFKDYSSGELSSRSSYVNSLCSTLVNVALNTGLTSVFSLVYITQIFAYAPGLVIPALIIIAITVGFTVISSFLQMKLTKKQMLLGSKESGMSYAVISGIQKIKLTGAEKRAFARWGDLYAKVVKLRYDPPMLIKMNSVISSAISIIGTIVMYNQAIVTHVSTAEYIAFNTAYGMVSGAFMSLFGMALTAANVKPTFEMAEPILKAEPEISENKETLTGISGNIELINLTFRYKKNSQIIIDNLSLRITPGQYVAIVGKTGCGKSTLVRLLLGFEKPTKGGIFYDGKDINALDLRSLRKNIGVVTQNGKLFQGDIFSNIVIAAPHLTLKDAWEAARIAGIDEDIKQMPMGMNTLISEGSGGISGGQKQRLMIARAVAPKPKLLIFDEATSALDNITQKKVSDALSEMDCTRIVIAHRLSTIKQCDRILVLDGGHIVEDGTYDELMKHNGFFASLVERQRVDA